MKTSITPIIHAYARLATPGTCPGSSGAQISSLPNRRASRLRLAGAAGARPIGNRRYDRWECCATGLLLLLALLLLPARLPAAPPNGPGGALGFDGVNDYLSAAPAALPAGNSPYTIEAWINTAAMNAGTIAAWGNYGVDNQVNAFRLTPTGLVNYWWANDLNVAVNLVGGWHHVAATFDGVTRRILVDGIVLGSDMPAGHNAGSGNFTIGSGNGVEFFSGQMDEVRIWNTGRTAAQILEAMRRQLAGNESGLVANWRFDEGSGLAALDATGAMANTAALVNGPTWNVSALRPFAPTVAAALGVILSPASASLDARGVANDADAAGWLEWGVTTSYGNTSSAFPLGAGSSEVTWSVLRNDFTPGATYHARAVASNAHGYSFGTNFSFIMPPPPPALVVVNNLNDNGPDSLRDALARVASGGTITFAPYLLYGTIVLTSGELVVNKSVNILGPGPDQFHISGNNALRVFNITAGTNLISGLTIRNGLSPLGPVSQGAGVFNLATLTLSNCTFLANTARGVSGGGIPTGMPGTPAYGGGLCNLGRLTLVACTFSFNEARGGNGGNGINGGNAGGQAGHGGAGGGGAVWNENTADIINCTFSTNRVFGGNGGNGGVGAVFDGDGGNGGNADGGAIVSRTGQCYLEHVTVVGNEATRGVAGAGEVAGLSGYANGGGLFEWPVSGTIILRNSLIALNRSVDAFTSGPSDVAGDLASNGHNLIGVTNLSSTAWQPTDRVGSLAAPLDPMLGAWGRNFGSTPNYALQTDSPAVDAGDDASLLQLATDQRGFPRRSTAHVDIGAYELCHDLPAFEVTTLTDHSVGSLRAAIECLAPGGAITFAPGIAGFLHLQSGELMIDKDLTLSGPGADLLTIRATNSRVFRVTSGRVHISRLNLLGGIAFGASGANSPNAGENGGTGSDGEGGGILNFGDLTLTDCIVRWCVAGGGYGGTGGPNFGILAPGTGGTGGAGRGGGICNRGSLTLLRCTLANNTCYGGPGGPGGDDGHIGSTPGGNGGNGGAAIGGGLYNAGLLFATNCTIVTNQVLGSSGARGGFGIPGGGNGGNGAWGYGAGFGDDGTATVVSCTFTANRASGGAFGSGGTGSSFSGGNGVSGESAGGGIFCDNVLPAAYVRNSLTAGNIAANGSDVLGGVISGGFNFVGTFNDGAFVTLNPFTEPTDIVGEWPTILDPRFGRLDYHGGTTLTLALLFNSPALDRGHASGAATDQRGQSRPADQPFAANASGGDGSDIGAYEGGPPPILTIRLGAPMAGINTVILTWPHPSTGYVLQQTVNMNAPGGGWVNVAVPPVIVGPNQEVTLPATGQFCLFRLRGL